MMAPSLVDAHVHLHDCFDCIDLLENAARNFEAAAREEDLPETAPGVLLFADPAEADSLARLRAAAADGLLPDWAIDETAESGSLHARGNRLTLLLVAGKQITTREGMEVLALGCLEVIPDGLDLMETIDAAHEHDSIVALAWGFGKWWLRRGRLVKRAVQSASRRRIWLGDNGGRSSIGLQPKLFRLARQHGVLVLPGSDPLPFPDHVARAGSFGFVSSGPIHLGTPAESLKAILRGVTAQPRVYGQLLGPWSFLRNQVAMQVRKRFRTSLRTAAQGRCS